MHAIVTGRAAVKTTGCWSRRACRTAAICAVFTLLSCARASGSGSTERIEPVGTPARLALETDDFLARSAPHTMRVMSLNVGGSSLFHSSRAVRMHPGVSGRPERLRRVITSINPDILCLQEIEVPHGSEGVAAMMESLLPQRGGQRWQAAHSHDNVIASRFPIVARTGYVADFGSGQPRGHVIVSIDVPDSVSLHDPVAICAHFQSKGGSLNISSREKHADFIVKWLRSDLASFGSPSPIDERPIVLMGDLNVLDTDDNGHLRTLVDGVLSTERGKRRASTPAGPRLRDILPTHNDQGDSTYTWRDDTQRFNPGALDRVLVSYSSAQVVRAFVLNTMTMPDQQLARYGLERADVILDHMRGVHDHLPIVADLRFVR